jgi:hypothetical protein
MQQSQLQSQEQSPQGTQSAAAISSNNLGRPYTWQNVVLLIIALLINLTTSGTILGWPNIVVVLRQLGTNILCFVKFVKRLFKLCPSKKTIRTQPFNYILFIGGFNFVRTVSCFDKSS